jgi:hypothetical protein
VYYLRRTIDPATVDFWTAVAADPGAPVILRELPRGPQVVCDAPEGEEVMAYARGRPEWREDPAPVRVVSHSTAP